VSWVLSCPNLAQAANLPSATAARWRDVDPFLHSAAEEMGVPYPLVVAVAHVETRFNPWLVSSAGARGLMQTMPSTGEALSKLLAIPYTPHDARASARMGALYLQRMIAKFGELDHAIAAYNAGPGAVQKYGGIPPYEQTQKYVPAVRRAMRAVAASELRCAADACPPNSTCPPSIVPQWRPAPYGYSGSDSSAPSRPPSPQPPSPQPPSPPAKVGGGLAFAVIAALILAGAASRGAT
jgi:hypothetical protein